MDFLLTHYSWLMIGVPTFQSIDISSSGAFDATILRVSPRTPNSGRVSSSFEPQPKFLVNSTVTELSQRAWIGRVRNSVSFCSGYTLQFGLPVCPSLRRPADHDGASSPLRSVVLVVT